MDMGHEPITDEVIAPLRKRVEQLREARDEYAAQAKRLTVEIRRNESALALLTNEQPERRRGRPRDRGLPSILSEERLGEIEAFIREYAREHDEFRQVDVRSAYGKFASGSVFTSGLAAIGFEELRQRGVLRIARLDGNSKYYRLTREALRKQ